MAAELIYEDDDVVAVHQAGRSAYTLVTFGGAGERPAGTSFWADEPVSKLGLEAIGFVAKRQNWYPQSAMTRAASVVASRMQPVRIGFGYSMGGYGVLKHGTLLGLTHALALSPQASINPEDCPDDVRFARFHDPQKHASMRVEAADLAPFAVQVADPYDRCDWAQARLVADSSNIHTIRLPFFGHDTMKLFIGTTVLEEVLRLLAAADIAGLRSFVRRHRARSAYWPLYMGRVAMAHGHRKAAEALLENSARKGARPGELLTHKALGLEQSARKLFERQSPDARERGWALVLEAAETAAHNRDIQVRLGSLLMRHRRYADALPLLRRAVKLDPNEVQRHLALIDALHVLGHMDEALEATRIAASLLPNDRIITRQLGYALLTVRDHIGAEAAFRFVLQTAESDEERSHAAAELSHVLYAQCRLGEAIEMAEMALSFAPGETLALERHLAQLYLLSRNLEAAEARLRTVLEEETSDLDRAETALDLCQVLTEQRKYEEALSFAQIALTILPRDSRARWREGFLRATIAAAKKEETQRRERQAHAGGRKGLGVGLIGLKIGLGQKVVRVLGLRSQRDQGGWDRGSTPPC